MAELELKEKAQAEPVVSICRGRGKVDLMGVQQHHQSVEHMVVVEVDGVMSLTRAFLTTDLLGQLVATAQFALFGARGGPILLTQRTYNR